MLATRIWLERPIRPKVEGGGLRGAEEGAPLGTQEGEKNSSRKRIKPEVFASKNHMSDLPGPEPKPERAGGGKSGEKEGTRTPKLLQSSLRKARNRTTGQRAPPRHKSALRGKTGGRRALEDATGSRTSGQKYSNRHLPAGETGQAVPGPRTQKRRGHGKT